MTGKKTEGVYIWLLKTAATNLSKPHMISSAYRYMMASFSDSLSEKK